MAAQQRSNSEYLTLTAFLQGDFFIWRLLGCFLISLGLFMLQWLEMFVEDTRASTFLEGGFAGIHIAIESLKAFNAFRSIYFKGFY